MTSSSGTELEVIGPPQQEVVLSAAQRRVLEQMEKRLPAVPMPAKLTWRFVGGDADRIEVGMSDSTDPAHPAVRREYKAAWVTEPEPSGLIHLEVLGDLTSKRVAAAAHRVERSFVNLGSASDARAEG